MNLQIASVKVQPDNKLHIKFKNGKTRLFDIKPYLSKGIFKELKNEAYLKKVRVIWGGIEWPHEQDLSVDTLYYRGISINKRNKSSLNSGTGPSS